MRRVSTTGAMALLAFAPAAASATTLAHCERYDTSGLVAPWSSAKLSQPDEETRWSVETGRLVRLSVRGSEERVRASLRFALDDCARGGRVLLFE